MSNASRDTSSPYAETPHHGGPQRKVEFAGPQETYVVREMGDCEDANKTIKGETLNDALRRYAKTKWHPKASLCLPIYIKVIGERYIRCVQASGKVEVMPW
ncbi:hypothetical protein N8510_01300 [bacterium]|nr:hypothetical protein [bacterium]